MGCASSSPRGNDQDASARPPSINSTTAETTNRAAVSTTARIPRRHPSSARPTSRSSHRRSIPATALPPSPLRPPPPYLSVQAPPPSIPHSPSHSTRWNQLLLSRERRDFFDTRVTGRPEVWQAVRLAVELSRDTGDWIAARNTLEAAGCVVTPSIGRRRRTAPSRRRRRTADAEMEEVVMAGEVGFEVWDERGDDYECPVWVWADPGDLQGGDGEVSTYADVISDWEEEDGKEGAEVRASVENGKENALGGAQEMDADTKIAARLSDRGNDVVVLMSKEWSVRTLISRIADAAEISSSVKVKLAYMGRVLAEQETLVAQGWQEGHVINVLVFQ